MSQSLFTTQTPVSANNGDGTPGISVATTVKFAVAGTVSGIRFYATTAVSGVYTASLYRVVTSDSGGAGTGTLLASKTMGVSPTPGTWNSVLFTTPVAVISNALYRATIFNGDGRYVASPNFFTSGGGNLVNGDITAWETGSDPIGLGSQSQGTFLISATPGYPETTFNATCYFADVLFDSGSATIVDLAANLTATGSLTAGLTDERPLAASLTATGSMSAALTREVTLAASLTATGSMSASFGGEVTLAANLSATAGLTVTDRVETTLRATLAANGSMSAALTIPSTGPVDPIATPVATALLACLTEQMQTLPSPPARIQLRAGAETGPLIGPNVDECCAGLAWVRVANVYPSWDSFPGPDNTWLPCGPLAYAVVLEMGSAFCMPWSDSDDSFDNLDPPSTADWQTAFNTLMVHQTLMRRAAACCFLPTQRRAVGEWSPLSVEGGCTGGTLRVTVSVMAPCGDC